ncbi:hypothetical protein DS901_17140 [Loktanella sp. D2R18]|nr:hypothetical protein DS901_17140 [Loktanella sp. D2R18]
MTVSPDIPASVALALMSKQAITAILVVDRASKLLGLLQIHDCVRADVGGQPVIVFAFNEPRLHGGIQEYRKRA